MPLMNTDRTSSYIKGNAIVVLLVLIAAMVAGSAAGLTAYAQIAPYCAALVSTAVSALVMAVGTSLWPEQFHWRILREG